MTDASARPNEPPSVRSLALATLVAAGVAVLALVLFVLPAEYGVDPTGVGAALGLTEITEPPAQEEPEAIAPQATIATFTSSFPLATTQVATLEGYLAEGDTVLLPFTLATPNVTRVTMRIEFSDANTTPSGQGTRPDTFEIELKAPHGDVSGGVLVRSEATSGAGLGQVVFDARPPPPSRDYDATSLADARAAFERNDPPDASAAGEWRARVTMVDAGDADAQGVPLGAGPVADTGNTWRATIHVTTWSLDVAEKPGTRQRADTVVLHLAPGGEMEYKLQMGLGRRVDWAWRTDGPTIYVDFHGEKTGDASGAFTRHKNGDFAADSGTLLAPFDGRHGWYWRNGSPTPVAITLDTRGQYEVIGRV